MTAGRQPLPLLAAVLTFLAEVNQVKLEIKEVAKEVYWACSKQDSIQAGVEEDFDGSS